MEVAVTGKEIEPIQNHRRTCKVQIGWEGEGS